MAYGIMDIAALIEAILINFLASGIRLHTVIRYPIRFQQLFAAMYSFFQFVKGGTTLARQVY